MFTLYISLLNQRLGEFPLLVLIYYYSSFWQAVFDSLHKRSPFKDL